MYNERLASGWLNQAPLACRDVSTCSGLPVLADADTGFGETEAIPRVVHEYSRAGAAGFHIEDQVGHPVLRKCQSSRPVA